LTSTIILADHPTDIGNYLIESNIQQDKIFSFNIGVHKILEKQGISHEIAENYLSAKDRSSAYDLTLNLYEWYNKDPTLKNFQFQNINLLGMLDTAEFHQLIISNLIDFLIVKKIIEKEKPKKIFTTKNLYNSVKILTSDTKIEIIIYGLDRQYSLAWDQIHIKFNLGRIPISFSVGRKKYLKILNIIELILSKIFNLYFKPNKKKSILLLEFDPSKYADLLSYITKNNANVVLLNTRRTSLWSIGSIKSVLHSKSKIINFNKFSSSNKNQIESLIKTYNEKLDLIFSNDFIFNKIFYVDHVSFWPCIKTVLTNTYKKRLSEYISLLISSKEIFEKFNFNSILALNIVGETEKSIIGITENKIPFILLEHGFSNHTHELKKFDIFHMYPLLKDKIAVWGNIQKDYLLNERQIDIEKIIVTGSPRHDPFFKEIKKMNNLKKTVLITPHPITNLSGKADTNLYLRFENLLRNLCVILKTIPNLEIIIKLHPGQDDYNHNIISLLHDIDSNIKIYQLNPIIDLIESCNLLINISPESFDTSTVMMEGLIMNKPVINILLDDTFHQFLFVKEESIISISDKSDLEKILKDVLFNQSLQSQLQKNGKNFLAKYLVNPGNASENLAKILTSY
jgi:hypothetical protein